MLPFAPYVLRAPEADVLAVMMPPPELNVNVPVPLSTLVPKSVVEIPLIVQAMAPPMVPPLVKV